MDTSISTRDILNVVFRQKGKILIFFFSIVIFVTAGLYAWPETYKTSSILLVKVGRENASLPSVLPSAQPVFTYGVKREQVNSEIEIIRSNHLITKAVSELGLEFLFPEPVKPTGFWKIVRYYARKSLRRARDCFREILYGLGFLKRLSPYESAVSAIQKKLDVSNIKNSNVIKIELSWNEPVIVSAIINKLIGLYMDYRMELYRIPGALELFDTETAKSQTGLDISGQQLQDFRKKWGIVALEAQKKTLVERISGLKKALQENQSDIYKTQNEIGELTKHILGAGPVITGDDNKEQLLGNESLKGKTNKDDISLLINPTFPVALPELQQKLVTAEVRLAGLKEKEKSLLEHLAKDQLESQRLGEKEIDLLRLEREFKIKESNYERYIKKLEESRISQVMDSKKIANVSVVSFAPVPFKPARPRKLLIFIIGIVMGVFGGVAIAFYSEYLDHSIKNPEEVDRYLKLPVLASVRKVKI
ncbi:MAG: GumC family protein [Planctomycetota bacterium]|jgi:uncharacterized protein involved in exopolysaccharide biosynthesis